MPSNLSCTCAWPPSLSIRLGHVGQAFGELRANRPTDRHLSCAHGIQPLRPQRASEQAEVRGAVVGVLEHPLLRLRALQARLGERGQDGHVAHAQPAGAERDAHQVLTGDRIDLGQQAGQGVDFALGATRAAQVGNGSEAREHLAHDGSSRRSACGRRRAAELLDDQAQVAVLGVARAHVRRGTSKAWAMAFSIERSPSPNSTGSYSGATRPWSR